MRPRGSLIMLGVALVAMTSSPASANVMRVMRVTRIAAVSPFPHGCPPYAANAGALDSEYEPTVAADPRRPRHVIAAWVQDSGMSVVSAASSDNGRTWRRRLVPGVSHCTGGRTGGAVNPWLSFRPDGGAYLSVLGGTVDGGFPLTNARTTILVDKTPDDGLHWRRAPAVQPLNGTFYDRPAITADPRASRTAYCVWENRTGPAGAAGIAYFSRTDDGGASWSAPREIYDPGPLPYPQYPHGHVISVLPDGTLLDVFGLMNDSPFLAPGATVPGAEMAVRSTDGGRTWSAPVRIATVNTRIPGDGNDRASQHLIALGVPSAAVDRKGRVYVTWQQDPTPSTGRILLSRSVDGGRTWSAARAIVRHAGQAYLPVLAVDRRNDLGLLWYDARTDIPGDGRLDTAVWFAHSHNGGRTWQGRALTGIFDALSGPDWYGAGRDIGHYIALAPIRNRFDAAFAQAKPRAVRGDTDLFFAQIALR